jgi:hypothetical protein
VRQPETLAHTIGQIAETAKGHGYRFGVELPPAPKWAP